jgi:murein DD-endopeptidase MepM/ murein hydrolase activator NlpD
VLGLALAALIAAPAGAAGPGGAYSSPVPAVAGVECRTDCAGIAVARPGSVVVVRGRNLDTVDSVAFLGGRGAVDDVAVEPERVSTRRLTVRVPRGAATGPVAVRSADGAPSNPSRQPLRVGAEVRRPAGGSGPAVEVALSGRKVFFDAERPAGVTFLVRDSGPLHVFVELVRERDGAAVARWDQGFVPPGEPRTLNWDGTVHGRVMSDGRYAFRVFAENGAGARAATTPAGSDEPVSPDSFLFVGHRFPVRGAHDFGGFAASFGGGRGHQGQDVFADCGTPIVAARGGTVKLKQRHARAGNYLVIDGEQTGVDFVYMHLRDPALVAKGDRVHTGQPIGYVGDTGHADGCHLHFEVWEAPGWYTGGRPFDPLPLLRAWDRFS